MIKILLNLIAVAAVLVAASARAESVAALEMRGEAAILGDAVRLRQIARWTETDSAFFRDLGELTITRFEPDQRELTLNLDAVRTLLEGAGVNEGQVSLRGPTTVKVRRLDADAPHAKQVKVEQPKDLETFLAQPAVIPAETVKANNRPAEGIDAILPEKQVVSTEVAPLGTTLRAALTQYLSERINIPAEDIEIAFPATHDRVLGVAGPSYSWRISTFRTARLGQVKFRVSLSNGAVVREVDITGVAKAWREQIKVARGVAVGQVLREADLESKRELLDSMPENMPIRREAALSMQATRELRPGDLLTMSMLKPVLLVRKGDLVFVTTSTRGVEIKSSGTAKTDGVYGGTVEVVYGDARNKRVVQVIVTGPQEGRTGTGEVPAALANAQ